MARAPEPAATVVANSAATTRTTDQPANDYAAHAAALRARLADNFTVVVEPPFVVIGDSPPATVQRQAASTVAWAVRMLEQEYFSRRPTHILNVWLFKDEHSYRTNARALFGSEPTTPYGYYSSDDRALVMNIATGGGTLVHEIVHPYIEANFPECPAWFNEGLGSLYEQSSERDGRIVGLTNWRLAGLQRAIRKGTLPSFAVLTATTTREFYEDSPGGDNYAQARYLLYYLQERGQLDQFYRHFRANAASDPSGYHSLLEVLGIGEHDLPRFEREWRSYVLALKFS